MKPFPKAKVRKRKTKPLEDITFYDGGGNYYCNGELLIRAENIH